MISGFLSVILFKFVFQNMEGVGDYFVALDVLAPSFLIAMIFGWIFSKVYPIKLQKKEELHRNEE
jgi:sodium/proline symporter